jgi:ubiquinone/menaquinone biosynthesis C-methylase UbiE
MAMKSKELYPAIFSRHAAAYEDRLEQVMSRGEARGRQRVVDLVEARPGMRILDIACGPGNLSARLAELVFPGGEVVGVDLAPGMIERARARALPNARFEVMDMERLDFADASFDAVTCGHGLQFAPRLDRALGEARRVLRPGSRFAASVPVGSPSKGVQELLDSVIDRLLPPAPRAVDQDETRRTVSDPLALEAAIRNAGFGEVGVEVVEEEVVWESADHLVALLASWWDCAARLEGVDAEARATFIAEATEVLRRDYPGSIATSSRNLVAFATA